MGKIYVGIQGSRVLASRSRSGITYHPLTCKKAFFHKFIILVLSQTAAAKLLINSFE